MHRRLEVVKLLAALSRCVGGSCSSTVFQQQQSWGIVFTIQPCVSAHTPCTVAGCVWVGGWVWVGGGVGRWVAGCVGLVRGLVGPHITTNSTHQQFDVTRCASAQKSWRGGWVGGGGDGGWGVPAISTITFLNVKPYRK